MMKNFIRVRFISVLMILISVSVSVVGGPFFVVVGSFSDEGGAREFASSIDKLFADASFRFDPGRKLYHVHVMETSRQDEAENFRRHIQLDKGFGHAWIFTDFSSGEGFADANAQASESLVELELYTGGSVLLGAEGKYYSVSKNNKVDIAEKTPQTFVRPLKFIAETTTGIIIPAKVSLMNKGRTLSAFKTGEVVGISGREQSQVLTLVCYVPGFSTDAKIIDIGNLTNTRDITQNDKGVWEVRFTVSKLKIDEVQLLYQDVFYPDAAVLQREYRNQIDALVTLLESNPQWKIVINSHCDEGFKRAIKVPGESYFDLEGAFEKTGTDKQLTTKRAETLRDYLVYQGIDKERITVMGWGSLDMVAKGAVDPKSNERVEVEVMGW